MYSPKIEKSDTAQNKEKLREGFKRRASTQILQLIGIYTCNLLICNDSQLLNSIAKQ